MEGWSKEGDKEFIYQNNSKAFELVKNEKLEGYVNEINIKTGKVNRCYKMNENHKPVGVGYVFNDKGEVSKIENYEGGNDLIVMKQDVEKKSNVNERNCFFEYGREKNVLIGHVGSFDIKRLFGIQME